MTRALFGAALLVLAADPVVDACTTFCVRAGERVLFGRNYDFETGEGEVIVNPSGLEKRGFLPGGPSWRSQFGSVTFNQFGREFPMGGMNEAGLVVEQMWLDDTKYPAPDARAPLSVLEWIQYQLDTSRTVADVLASDARVRVEGQVPLHYLVSDPTGAAATIEFLDGKLFAHTGERLPSAVLANDTYQKSLVFMNTKKGMPGGSGSKERFTRAARLIPGVAASGEWALARAFDVLHDVAQRETRWSIVYDQSLRIVHWRTDRHRPVRYLEFAPLKFTCGAVPVAIDVHTPIEGNAALRLSPLTTERNHTLVASSMKKTSFTRAMPHSAVTAQAAHGFAARCAS